MARRKMRVTMSSELPELGHPCALPATQDVEPTLAAFDSKALAWEEYTATPLGALRTNLALHYLQLHIATLPRATSLDVLDAGGGTGSYALPLAEQGHRVCLLDFSGEMLDVARAKGERLGPSVLERLEFRRAAVDDVSRLFPPDRFDIVLCHTLLEYVPDPNDVLRGLSSVLRSGGLASVLFVTPHADALRWALGRADMEMALRALDHPVSSADLFGLDRLAMAPDVVRKSMAEAGLVAVAEYGVRIFADHLPVEKLADPAFFARLWELESAAGGLDPYRQIGRYRQIIGRKQGAP